MTPLLKSLLGDASKDRERAEEMRAILHEMQEERGRYETVLERALASADRLQQLGEPLAKAGSDVDAVAARIADMEQRFAALAQLAGLYETLGERAEALTQSQARAETQIASALQDAQQTRATFEEIGQKIELAASLKDRLVGFLDVEKPFQQLQGEADALRGQMDGTGEQLARLREQHDRLLDAHKLAMSKMEALDRRREDLSRDLQDKERRVAGVEQSIRGMDGVQHSVDDIRREIGALKALGDAVVQKSAALEAQRAAVESALARADDLDRAMRGIDAGVRQQQANEKTLNGLQEQATALRALHEAVVERSGEISRFQRETDERTQATRQDLAAMTDEMKKTVERFDFESRGLESVTQRVTDLRAALSDFENRFKGLSEQSQAVIELRSQTEAVAAHLQALTGDVGHVDTELGHLQAIRRDLDETSRTVGEVGAQLARIEEARPGIEAALRDLTQLGSVHAVVKEALEQTQLAHDEIARVREGQSETRSWLAGVEASVGELKDQVGELNQMAPVVDTALKQAQRVVESTSVIETRREFVDDLQRRTAELGALAGRLDDRSQQLQMRMETAEQRFVALGEQADEAERLSEAMGVVSSQIQESERQAGEIKKAIAGIAGRCESVEELAERTRTLRQELDQRQRALKEATKDLHRSADLRQEAAAAAQQLDELAKRLTGVVSSADARLAQANALSTQLEERATNLRSVEKRLAEFEERLATWEHVEEEIARAVEQITARQGTVESLKADLERMFEMAEKTAADVRAITSARQELKESRGQLDDVKSRLREVRDTVTALDERKRQMSKAEERLARSEALLVDVRSSLEALQGQKAIVDQAVEKAGSLQFLLKQAEAMIDGLREEREMTARVRAAVAAVDRDEDDEEDEDRAKAA
jgi:chromosome segregation ATPase